MVLLNDGLQMAQNDFAGNANPTPYQFSKNNLYATTATAHLQIY